jgi:hypothetical protein
MNMYFLCVPRKTLLACITLYDIMPIMLSIYVWMIPMFIYLVCLRNDISGCAKLFLLCM